MFAISSLSISAAGKATGRESAAQQLPLQQAEIVPSLPIILPLTRPSARNSARRKARWLRKSSAGGLFQSLSTFPQVLKDSSKLTSVTKITTPETVVHYVSPRSYAVVRVSYSFLNLSRGQRHVFASAFFITEKVLYKLKFRVSWFGAVPRRGQIALFYSRYWQRQRLCIYRKWLYPGHRKWLHPGYRPPNRRHRPIQPFRWPRQRIWYR